ncbi:MAG: phosphotransferase [Chlamydiia bacterium]|nr:phosphotransferase [Chlamydiia bacterium]
MDATEGFSWTPALFVRDHVLIGEVTEEAKQQFRNRCEQELNGFESELKSLEKRGRFRSPDGRSRFVEWVKERILVLSRELDHLVRSSRCAKEAQERFKQLIETTRSEALYFQKQCEGYESGKRALDEKFAKAADSVLSAGNALEAPLQRSIPRARKLAQCLQGAESQGEGRGILVARCLSRYGEGVTDEEQREIAQRATRVNVGGVVNAVAAPYAVVSRLYSGVMKVWLMGAIDEGFREQGAGDLFHAMSAADPKFREGVERFGNSLPGWAKSVGRGIRALDMKISQVDGYLSEQFYAFPGLPSEAVYGAGELAIPHVAVMTWRVAKTTIQICATPLKQGVNATKRWVDGRHLVRISGGLSRSESSVEGLLSPLLQNKMSALAKRMNDYSQGSFQEVTSSFVREWTSSYEGLPNIIDVRTVLPKVAMGRSKDSVFIVTTKSTTAPLILKEFVGIDQKGGRLSHELLAYSLLEKYSLDNLSCPKLLKVGKFHADSAGENGLLMMTFAGGESLAVTLDHIAQLPLNRSARALALEGYAKSMEKAGLAFAELHKKSLSFDRVVSPDYVFGECQTIRRATNDVLGLLKGKGMDERSLTSLSQVEKIAGEFTANPGRPTLVHGDAHLGNFFWNPHEGRLTAIDPGALVFSLDAKLRPVGSPMNDYIKWKTMLEGFGSDLGLVGGEVKILQDAFAAGYTLQASPGVFSTEAMRFYEVAYRVLRLKRVLKEGGQLPSAEAGSLIAQIQKHLSGN